MNPNNHHPDHSPTPEHLAAWLEGGLSRPEVAAVEAWLAEHPEAGREVDSLQQVTRLYRDQAAPPPVPARWQAVLERIEVRVRPARPAPGRTAWRLRLLIGLTLASAALLGAVVLARTLWPTSTGPQKRIVVQAPSPDVDPEDDEPFPVSSMSEVNIIHMDAHDADRIVTGQPLMGPIEFASENDIDVVKVEPNPEGGHVPRLEQRQGMPMIVLARVEEDEL